MRTDGTRPISMKIDPSDNPIVAFRDAHNSHKLTVMLLDIGDDSKVTAKTYK